MRDFIETRLDIALQDPFWRFAFTQRDEALLDRIRRGPLFPKAIGVGITGGLRNGFKSLQIESLHGQVHFTRHASWPVTLPMVFRYPSPPQRLRSVAILAQLADRCGFLLWAVPKKAIYSRRPFAWVFCHPFNGQGLGRKRVGEQVLKGSHLPPSARLHRLHDTRLEPTHVAVSFGPVNGMPLHGRVGDRTSCRNGCHLPCLLDRLVKFSRDERPEGSQPAFAWGDVAEAQPLSAPLQSGVRLLPPPLPALRWARLAACFPDWAQDGLTTFRMHARMG